MEKLFTGWYCMAWKTVVSALLLFAFLLCMTGAREAYAQTEETMDDAIFIYEPELPASAKMPRNNTGGVAVSAAAAVLMDAETGQILFAKNPHQKRPIASTTKIMTALVAIECGNLKGMTTVGKNAAGVEGSSIYLREGEHLSLEELLYGALMRSGNDACVAIAEHIAGKEAIFVNIMNCQALRLGAFNTNFMNTNGLPDDRHLSTAYDLALITRYALRNPVFQRIVSTRSKSINGPRQPRSLSNTNKMLWSYQGANGVKTGTTSKAGRCLVSSATRNGHRLIAVVLNSGDRYRDSIHLLDYGFSQFEKLIFAREGETVYSIPVEDGVQREAPLTVRRDIAVTVPLGGIDSIEWEIISDNEFTAPVKEGLPAGKIQLLAGGKLVAETGLVTRGEINKLPLYKLVWKHTLGCLVSSQ